MKKMFIKNRPGFVKKVPMALKMLMNENTPPTTRDRPVIKFIVLATFKTLYPKIFESRPSPSYESLSFGFKLSP